MPMAPPAWSRRKWTTLLLLLTLGTLLVHGYHPYAEDGGLYAAGIEYQLNPALFPHDTEFVTEHLRFSVFAPGVAMLVHLTHLSLSWMLLLLELFSIWLTLFAARQILRRVLASTSSNFERAQLAGLALFAAWWTLPVAGTSLILMDPYVTARSFSTPLSLLAVAFALDDWQWPWMRSRSLLLCVLCLLAAAELHPLMAAYGFAFVAVVRASRTGLTRKTRVAAWGALALLATGFCAVLHALAPPESIALLYASSTRYYWFLSQWHWYERAGLVGPLVVVGALMLLRRRVLQPAAAALCRACVGAGTIAVLNAVLFARASAVENLVARFQVLRIYLLIYALMAMLLGAMLYQLCESDGRRRLGWLVTAGIVLCAGVMGYVQRQSFPASPHVELPGMEARNSNAWVRAFLWAKTHTPQDALFAMDAMYVNTEGEDAQNFRAIALRSSLPDYSKDGGEAAITPELAEQWQQGAAAQRGLSRLDDSARDERLRPLGVTWMLLHSNAATDHPCPYNNGTVKVCELAP
jgi:predicted membrane channel-forming protein YqfA (hemolysin III family)